MMALVGVKEDLSAVQYGSALEIFGHDTGIKSIRVSAQPHLIFVEFDEYQLHRVDIIEHMDQAGLHGRICGC